MDVPRLHPDTLAEVKQHIDLLEIVSDYIVLRKRGKNHLGLCPFHDEKTPSFTVSSDKQLYYCFGCGAGGNAFTFLMELEKRTFSEVVLELAQRHQIPIKTLEPEQRQALLKQLSTKEQLYEILASAANFYQNTLSQPQGETALEYLNNTRKFSEATIQKFQLGYAPAGWETLYRYLVDIKRYPVGLVEAAGLLKTRQSGEGFYDRFRDRVMIPIQDQQGRVIAFGSRTLTTEEPKYLNSPETLLFDKSQTLFALDKAYRSISQQDQVIIVEGYFDAIALHAAGINNVVACLGTNLTQSHLKKILRYTESKQVILNFDADSAGTQATTRVIEEIASLVYGGQIQLRVLHLPDGKDADEFLKTADEAITTYRSSINSAPLWLDWQLEQLLKEQNLKQGDQFQQVARKMVKLLNKLQNFELQAHYLGYCAELLSQGNPQLIRLYAEKLQIQVKKPQISSKVELPPSSQQGILEEAESTLLRIYLHHLEYRYLIVETLEEKDLLFISNEYRHLWLQIAELEQNATEPEDLISRVQDYYLQQGKIPSEINKLLMTDEKTLWEDEQRAPLVIQAAIASIEQVSLEKYRSYCLEKWQNLDPVTQASKMVYFYQEFDQAEQKLKALAKTRTNC